MLHIITNFEKPYFSGHKKAPKLVRFPLLGIYGMIQIILKQVPR
ncbi:hypothetical protein [Flavobacterium ginsenosidimutans]|uniref:Transposase n=1 Tax=Flavobacterium ginsenosidimutans TaxID=687844 RepID=A0ABZ2Q7N9_9FLAO